MTAVLAITEHHPGNLRDISFELITAGRELSDALDGDLHLAVIGDDVDGFADQLTRTASTSSIRLTRARSSTTTSTRRPFSSCTRPLMCRRY